MSPESASFRKSFRDVVRDAGDDFEEVVESKPADVPRGHTRSATAQKRVCAPLVDAVAFEKHVRRVFDRNAPFTVGAEEEFLLLDPGTDRLAPIAQRALALLEGDPRFVSELRSAQIEIVTPVCRTAADAAAELSDARCLAARRLMGLARIAAVGVHPTSRDPGPIIPSQRYAKIVADNPQIERRLLTCGLHVHVAVGGPERSLAVYNALRNWLPEIVALAANAPFQEGLDSGLATVRPSVNRLLPRSGVPPAFSSWAAYADFCTWIAGGGGAPDASYHWWDIRLHPSHGTIEVRAADAQTCVQDAATLIALVQSLAFSLAGRYDAGETLYVSSSERIAENMWLAARDGVHGFLIAATGDRRPTSTHLCALAEHLMPAATELGCSEELLGIERMVREGGGASRQREIAHSYGIESLCRWLADETTERLAQPPDPAIRAPIPQASAATAGTASGARELIAAT